MPRLAACASAGITLLARRWCRAKAQACDACARPAGRTLRRLARAPSATPPPHSRHRCTAGAGPGGAPRVHLRASPAHPRSAVCPARTQHAAASPSLFGASGPAHLGPWPPPSAEAASAATRAPGRVCNPDKKKNPDQRCYRCWKIPDKFMCTVTVLQHRPVKFETLIRSVCREIEKKDRILCLGWSAFQMQSGSTTLKKSPIGDVKGA